MATFPKDLLKYDYEKQDWKTNIPEDISPLLNITEDIFPLQNQALQNQKDPQFKGPGLFPGLFSQERREENKALRQKFYPQIKENFEQGNTKAGYEAFVQLPFRDQMLMYMTPGLGNIIDAYEMKYFGDLSTKANIEKHKSGEWDPTDTLSQDMSSLAMGYPFQQTYGPPPNLYGAMSNLAGASSLIGIGEAPSLLKGAALFAGRKTGILPTPLPPHQAQEIYDQTIDAVGTGKKDVPTGGGGTGGGGGRGAGDGEPRAGSMQFDVEERGEAMYNEQAKRGLNKHSLKTTGYPSLDRYDDSWKYDVAEREMYKNLRGSRLAVTTLEKAIEEMEGFDNPNKEYSMQEMLNLARKHGVEGTRSGVYNQNVLSQIDEFTETLSKVSPTGVVNLNQKITKQGLLDLINKHNPRFSETRTTYSDNFRSNFFNPDEPSEMSGHIYSPFVPHYSPAFNPMEAIERRTPDLTINSQFAINSRLAGDPRIEGVPDQTFLQSGPHPEIGRGFQYFGDDVMKSKEFSLGELDNNIFHNRSHIYNDFFTKGDRVLIASETQSPYTFTKDQGKIIDSGNLNLTGYGGWVTETSNEVVNATGQVDFFVSNKISYTQPNPSTTPMYLEHPTNTFLRDIQNNLDNYGNLAFPQVPIKQTEDMITTFLQNFQPQLNPSSKINQFRKMGSDEAIDFLENLSTTLDLDMGIDPFETGIMDLYNKSFKDVPKEKYVKAWQEFFDNTYRNYEEVYNSLGVNGLLETTPNVSVNLSGSTTKREFYKNIIQDFFLKNRENTADLHKSLIKELQAVKPFEKNIKLPMLDQWFNTSTKASMQDAVQNNATHILFPSNGKAVARQGGGATDLLPDNIRDYGDFPPGEDRQFGLFFEDFSDEWQLKQNNRGKQYKDLRIKAIEQAKKDYGIDLPFEEFTDDAGQEFLKIKITQEIADAFKVLRKNMGGAVSKALMPLKY
jgi:hypothetical protein|tara:strand:+ start:917 stop:3772 length:2856 start_codon:yes stop_codon:yes gene_type:complete